MLWLEDRLVNTLKELNYQYLTYELTSIVELQCLRYTQDSFFIPHTDLKSLDEDTQRKITFIIQLSDKDDYVGGDLKLYTQLPPISVSRQRASLIAFPSYTLHEVTPLLSGERYVLIGWCAGPHLM
jgi:PKHD-type hydroxylase